MIKLDDILAICIAALLTLSILFCTDTKNRYNLLYRR